jgi:hypothetical protein
MLWVRISIRAKCKTLCDKVCPWLATGRWFSPSPPVFSTNKTDRHDIAEILLKVALNIIKQTNKPFKHYRQDWNTANKWYFRGLLILVELLTITVYTSKHPYSSTAVYTEIWPSFSLWCTPLRKERPLDLWDKSITKMECSYDILVLKIVSETDKFRFHTKRWKGPSWS